jgi:hypothetical protein
MTDIQGKFFNPIHIVSFFSMPRRVLLQTTTTQHAFDFDNQEEADECMSILISLIIKE